MAPTSSLPSETTSARLDRMEAQLARIQADWNDPLLVARHLVDLLRKREAAK